MISARIRAAFAGIRDAYQTHRPVLCEAVLRVGEGMILELGAGEGSTLALHEVAAATGRTVITLDHDASWIDRFAHLRTPNHIVLYTPSWTALDNPIVRALPYGVAFVDHAPFERRHVDIAWLAECARVVVVHDTDHEDCGYSKFSGLFRHSAMYRGPVPWTSVLSNFVDVATWTF